MLVVAVAAQRVTRLEESTVYRIVLTRHTVVILLVAICIGADDRIAGGIQYAHVNWIDGSNLGGVVHQVGRTQGSIHVRVGLGAGMYVADVSTQLEPAFHLVVGLDTARDTLVTGILDNTVLVEVTQAGIEGGTVVTAVHAHAVILADSLLIGHFFPVVGLEPISLNHLLSSGIHHRQCIAQLGGRIQLTIEADELLTCINGVDLITQILDHIFVGLCVGGNSGHTVVIVVSVIEHGVGSLIVLGRVGDGLIILHAAAVHTPFGIEVHNSIAGLTSAGGDQDNTGSTTGTVQGSGSSILQNGNGFDIARGDVGKAGRIGSAINNDKGSRICIHGSNTTDIHGTATCTGSAGSASHLETGDVTYEGIGHIGSLTLLKFLGLDHRSRARKGLLGGGTEGNHDGFIQKLRILNQNNLDVLLTGDRNVLGHITQAAHLENTIGRNIQREVTSHISQGIDSSAAFEHYVCTDDSFAGTIDHITFHRDILCGEGKCRNHPYQCREKNSNFFHKHES